MSSSEDDWDWEEDEEDYQEEILEEIAPELTRGVSYNLMSEQEIAKRQVVAINKVSDSLGFNKSQAAALLMRFYWNPQIVIQKVIDGKCDGIIPTVVQQTETEPDQETLCFTCFENKLGKEMVGLECSHSFCKGCYTEYLKEAVSKGITSVFTTCPMGGCNLVVPEEMFKELLPLHLWKRFNMFLLKTFVDFNTNVKWCPAPECQYAVEYPKLKARNIICKCGYTWCFSCGQEAHRPLSCENLAKWKMKNSQEDIDSDWITANTKPCPKCGSAIQKNHGCMHMTCRCGHEFCWLCKGDWSEHGSQTGGFYKCNKFKAKKEAGEYEEEEKNRALAAERTRRYEHYFDRYVDHNRSLKLAKDKRTKMNQQIVELEQMIQRSGELSFLTESLDLLVESRRSLTYSYPLGFYIDKVSKLRFFEFVQGDMEKTVDLLDEKTDKDPLSFFEGSDYGKFMLSPEYLDFKMNLNNLVKIVNRGLKSFLEELEADFPNVEECNEMEEELFKQLMEQDNIWICSACTFANDSTHSSCQMCNTPR